MRVAVWGATGVLGTEVARLLNERHWELTLVGRDRAKLASLSAQLTPSRMVIGPSNVAELDSLFRTNDACVNCAPLMAATLPLAAAANRNACHFLDLSGEQEVIGSLIAADGLLTGDAAIIPACGFDYALGDYLAVVLAGTAREPLAELRFYYAVAGGYVVGNSLKASRRRRRPRDLERRQGRQVSAPLVQANRRYTFPVLGRRTVVRFGSGEALLAAVHSCAGDVRAYIDVTALLPLRFLTPVFPVLRPLAAWILSRDSFARVSDAVRHGRQGLKPHEVTTQHESSLKKGYFVVAAEGSNGEGRTWRAAVFGEHSETLSAVLVDQTLHGLLHSSRGVGLMTPGMVFDPASLTKALAELGIEVSGGAAGAVRVSNRDRLR